ncbi:Zn-dependent hydrolase [Dongia soli]|uniref:Zn-dependent hydrolase n=1 Tax=Dongia soli TaxID=600628 RepID=A0ABU5E5S7_9PROT|nr:Zn-dependent hydrolase [Dongia soli]MDY0881665.1 Zn-dependent hydrolase [Dongia soli]
MMAANGILPAINADRLMKDLRRLRQFGAQGNGVVRLALSPVDLEARHWLVERMAEAGLDAAIDGVGTVFGRSRKPGPALLIGSHSDTQPTGGWLDGAMGVIFGLEIARALSECAETSDLAVDVASWIDEEGTFAGYLGSRSFIGEPVEASIRAATSRSGERLEDVLQAAGLRNRPRAQVEPGRHVAYLEPHIEQGGRLEAAGKSIGVVTTIVGIREKRITFTGQRNHAGTTPMAIRRDAGAALIAFAHDLNQIFQRLADADTVWTVGRIELDPGSFSVVPGKAELLLQYRDAKADRLRAMDAALADLVRSVDSAGLIRVHLEDADPPCEPVDMTAALQEHIAVAAEAIKPGQWIRMPSGAGHDAQLIAEKLPSGMLFVPSIGGVSHDFTEDTAEEHIVLGCRIAAAAAVAILRDRQIAKSG